MGRGPRPGGVPENSGIRKGAEKSTPHFFGCQKTCCVPGLRSLYSSRFSPPHFVLIVSALLPLEWCRDGSRCIVGQRRRARDRENKVADRHFISEERRNLWKFCDTRSFLLLIKLALLPLIGYTYILHDGFGRNGNRRAIQWNLCHKLDHCQEQRWLQLKPMQCEKVKRD